MFQKFHSYSLFKKKLTPWFFLIVSSVYMLSDAKSFQQSECDLFCAFMGYDYN